MHIFIGNLPLDVTDERLQQMFEPFGKVHSAMVGTNKKTGAHEGYGIVEMPVKAEAREAVEGLRGKHLTEGAAPLIVRVIKPDDPFHAMTQSGGMKGGAGPRSSGVRSGGGGAIRTGGQRGS